MSEAAKKEKVQMDPKYIIKLSVTLLIICLVVSLMLGLVNGITADKIAALQEQAKQESLQAVFPDASFNELEIGDEQLAAAAEYGVELMYIYEVADGSGYAIEVGPSGFNGTIDMIVGINTDGTVAGISVISNSETAGIGTNVCADKPNKNGVGVLSQFVGMSATADNPFTVNSGSNKVDAISGATVSTRAITNGVNAASVVFGTLG